MLVESVMDRIKDNISLDFLARLIVDVHQVWLRALHTRTLIDHFMLRILHE